MKQAEKITSLYTQYVNDLHTYALYLGFDHETAMDAIHDVFFKLAADKKSLDNVTNFKFYLFKSLKNRLIDLIKNKKEYVKFSTMDENQDIPFNIRVTVEDKFIDREEQTQIEEQIAEMLNSLTERQREVIYLRYIQEYDYQQIAELLNISIHGCRKLVSKAMQNLREKYGVLALLFLFS